MFVDFNITLMATEDPLIELSEGLRNWSCLALVLIFGVACFVDWIRRKLKERGQTSKKPQVEAKNNFKEQPLDVGETKNEFRVENYVDVAEMPDSTQIYISRGDKPSGPYPLSQVNEYLEQGLLLPDDLASHDESGDYFPLSELIENLNPEEIQKKITLSAAVTASPKTRQMDVKDLIGEDISGATHMALEHVRLQSFRWMALLELPLFILLFIVFLPCALILVVILAVSVGGAMGSAIGEGGLGAMLRWALANSVRIYDYKHQLFLKVYGSGNDVLAEASHIPSSKKLADNLIIDLFEGLHSKQLVMIEMLDAIPDKNRKSIKEHLVTWYGGRPLMALQKDFVEKDSKEALQQKGWDFKQISGGFSCTREMKAEDNIAPIWAHLLFWMFFPPSLLLFFFKSYRNYLRESWLYGSEDKKPDWEFTVKADQLKLVKKRPRRNTSKLEEEVFFDIHGRDLIGICYTAGLGYDNDATYHGKTVKIYTNQGVISLPQILDVNLDHVCNWLVGVTLRLRSERPELGLGFDPNRPTKCPYCASIYVFKPGQSCPSCGGWPDRIN